jgi:colanic acid/amylovoran biosynthesis glycosyltransferase
MRIAIIAGGIPSTTFIDALINGLAERGYSITVIGKKIKPCSYAKNVNTIEIPSQRISQLLFIGVNLWKMPFHQILRIYKNSNSLKLAFFDYLYYLPLFMAKPDKVHIQWAADLYKKELLFDLFRNKIILSLRGSHINYTPIIKPKFGEFYKKVFPKVHKFHAVSNAIAMEAQKYEAAADKISTIYSSVDDNLLNKIIQPKNPNAPFNFIVVGRFHWVKGYNYLLDALAIFKKKKLAFNLLIIAGDNVTEEVIFSIHQNKLTENIKIVNNLPHYKVLTHIENADLLILTSVNEGIANVVIEAMTLGTIALSSNCGGMPELIEEGINGLLFDNRNAIDLAKKISGFTKLSDREKQIIRENAKGTIATKFTKTRMLDAFENLYS